MRTCLAQKARVAVQRILSGEFIPAFLGILVFGWAENVGAQESLRLSLAGADAARARREAANSVGYYNLKLGPTAWTYASGLSAQYNDNLRSDPSNPEQDLIFRPEAGARMRWPVSQVNELTLTLAGGYAIYTTHSEYDRPFIRPGSELSLDLYAGDFWINLHDRFAIVENGYLDPTVTGIADYLRLDNTLGFTVTADFNKLVAKLGYDHAIYRQLGGAQGQPDADMDVFSTSLGYQIRAGDMAGMEAGASLIHYLNVPNDFYSSMNYSDGVQWNTGAFYDAQIAQYVHARLSSGYSQFLPQSGFASQLEEDLSGIYAQASISHRLNKFVDYVVSGGRALNFAYYGGLVDQYFVSLSANWHVLNRIGLQTSLAYQHGKQFGTVTEIYDWVGPSLSMDRQLTKHLHSSLAYQFYWRDSDLAGRNYTVNLVTLSAVYRF